MRMEGSGTVASTSGTWFGADSSNTIPGQPGTSISAPAISSGTC
jgi:hypothetical protein